MREESQLEEMRAAVRGDRERAEQARLRSTENVRAVLEPRDPRDPRDPREPREPREPSEEEPPAAPAERRGFLARLLGR